jgi:hypothetical protein
VQAYCTLIDLSTGLPDYEATCTSAGWPLLSDWYSIVTVPLCRSGAVATPRSTEAVKACWAAVRPQDCNC